MLAAPICEGDSIFAGAMGRGLAYIVKRIAPVRWLISASLCIAIMAPGAVPAPPKRSPGTQNANAPSTATEQLERERADLTRRKEDLDAKIIALQAQADEIRARQDAENALRIGAQMSQNALLARRRELETDLVKAQTQWRALSRAQADWIRYLVRFEPISAHQQGPGGTKGDDPHALSLEAKLVALAVIDVGQQAESERRKIVQIDARIGALNARYMALKPGDEPGQNQGAGNGTAASIEMQIADKAREIVAVDAQIQRVGLALDRERHKALGRLAQQAKLERAAKATGNAPPRANAAAGAKDVAAVSLSKTPSARTTLAPASSPKTSHPIQLIAPIAGPVRLQFGQRDGALRARGIGYGVLSDRKVVAPASGKVVFADHFGSYGRLVMIDLGSQYVVALSGMAQTSVRSGEMVKSGDEIGWMNADEAARGSELRLRLEFWHAGVVIDPSDFLVRGR